MKYFLVVKIIIVLLFISCNHNRPSKPDNLISKAEMINIIEDIYLLNAAKSIDKNVTPKRIASPETYILKKYNIDSIQFANSSNYYSYDVDTYTQIIEVVKSRLEAKKTHYDSIKKAENEEKKRVRDSLRDANAKNDTLSKRAKDSLKQKFQKDNVIKNKRQFKLQDSLLKEARNSSQ